MVKLGAERRLLRGDGAVGRRSTRSRTFQPPVVKAVEVLIETGDFHVTTIGDNLPNENEIHEKYGTKNFLFLGQQPRARRRRRRRDADGVRGVARGESTRGKKYGEEAEDLLTAMHEVIGHGSGKLSDRLKGGAEPVPEGVLLDARGSARRPDGALEHLGSEAEGARAGQGSGRGREGDVRQRRARRADAAAPHPEGRHDRRGSPARPRS